MRRPSGSAIALLLLAGACARAPAARDDRTAAGFPRAARPVASIVSAKWSTEPDRDRVREAASVMAKAGVKTGMTVADLGAGEGYYTVRLAKAVGPTGRVLAEDIMPDYRDRLAARIYREKLDNVSVRLGTPADPGLPSESFDRIFLIHMYHEIAEPYEFVWRMRPALKPGGLVVVVDADRPTANHGTPPRLLACEFAAAGYRQVSRTNMPEAGGYLALFAPRGARPDPRTMRTCGSDG